MLENKARKILVIKFRHIGDVLLTSPLITTLKRAHSENQVAIAVKPGTQAMLEGHPDLDQLFILPTRKPEESAIRYLFRYIQWIWQLRHQNFDVALNTTKGDHGVLLGLISGAKVRISMTKNPEQERWWRRWAITHPIPPVPGKRHTVIRNLHLANPITHQYSYSVKLHCTEKQRNAIKQLLLSHGWDGSKRLIHIHPTSRWLFKCWKNEYMGEVIDWIQQHNCLVVITAAPDTEEIHRVKQILEHCTIPPVNLAGLLSLQQMAAVSSVSDLFFGVDSAPMHIAASQQTPTIALFGPSRSYEWGPWPNQSADETPYHVDNGIQTAGSHTIIQLSWECTPCSQSGCNRSKKSRCLDELLPISVIPIIQKKLTTISP